MPSIDLASYSIIIEYINKNFDYDSYYKFFDAEDRHTLYLSIYNSLDDKEDVLEIEEACDQFMNQYI